MNLSKQLAVLFLLAAFAVQTFNSAALVVSYYTNTKSYAANCENKAKPMLHCNGRCQLLKKLKQEENKEKQSPERKSERKVNVLSSKSFFAVIRQASIIPSGNFSLLQIGELSDIPGEFFHPPSA